MVDDLERRHRPAVDLGGHYARWIGPIATAHGDGSDLVVFVCYALEQEFQVFASEGLTCGEEFRQEVLVCTSDLEDLLAHAFGTQGGGSVGEAAGVFSAIRALLSSRRAPLTDGEVLSCDADGRLREWYVMKPVFFEEEIERFPLSDPPTEIWLLITLLEDEGDWIRTHGGKAFEAFFDDVNIFDPNRPRISALGPCADL